MSSIDLSEERNDVNRLRSVLAQFIAMTIANLQYIDAAYIMTMPTIIIPALTGHANQHNLDEYLTMTAVQASWLASLGGLLRPLGSIGSAYMSDKLGRKRTMILVNIPIFVGWYILYRATTLWEIFTAFLILGTSFSLGIAPIMNFSAEICEPSTRSVLFAYSTINMSLAAFLILTLNTVMGWRVIVAYFCMAVPLISLIALCFIPETPQWLLSRDRVSDAEKSLCWFRGWISRDKVAQELREMQQVNAKSNQESSDTSPSFFEKIAEFKRKRTLQPFIIVIFLYLIVECTGVLAMSPYIVQIFRAYNSPIQPDKAAALLGFTDILANVTFICIIRFTGKRRLYLTMGTTAFLSLLVISCYGFIYLPAGYTSFNQQNVTFVLENKYLAYIPFICLFLKQFCVMSGLVSMSGLFLSELFSFKARSIACGFTPALANLLVFIFTKLYYDFEVVLSLQGITMLFCVLTGAGLVLMYFILPETEGCTLKDIEQHFSDESTKITDWKIITVVDKSRGFEKKKLLR